MVEIARALSMGICYRNRYCNICNRYCSITMVEIARALSMGICYRNSYCNICNRYCSSTMVEIARALRMGICYMRVFSVEYGDLLHVRDFLCCVGFHVLCAGYPWCVLSVRRVIRYMFTESNTLHVHNS